MSPTARVWTSSGLTLGLIGSAVFVAAGTVDYWQAWAYFGILVMTGVPLTLLIVKDPLLRENRTRGGPTVESRPLQRVITLFLALAYVGTIVVPGLGRRFGWSCVPPWLSIAGDVGIVVSMWMVSRVFKANSFGSATVQVAPGQRVISTGPYAFVRHPMYTCASLYFFAMSLALGSWWALLPSGVATLAFVWRLFDEERMLAKELPGYAEYRIKVRWRLVPGVF